MRLFFNNHLDSYKKQTRVALVAFLLELPNLIISVVSGVLSNTLLVWIDTFQSLQSTTHCLIVFLVANMLRKDTGDRYNFGAERLETFISFISNLLVLLGYFAVLGVAVYGIFNPVQPENALGLFVILKAFNIAFDIYLYASQAKATKARKTQMSETELQVYMQNLISDVVIGVLAVACYFLRDYQWSWYISSIASLILGAYFIYKIFKKIKEAISELSDASIPIANQDELMDIVLTHANEVKKIYSVDCRVLNHKVYVDINMSFKDDTTYVLQIKTLEEIESSVKTIYPDSITRIVTKVMNRECEQIEEVN